MNVSSISLITHYHSIVVRLRSIASPERCAFLSIYTNFHELKLLIIQNQVCGMEMRPAKGRADIILGRERFRCSRCGAKAAAYFNIDNLEDPRAVARSVN